MGILSSLFDAAATANQDAHGERLLVEFYDSVARIGRMPSVQSDEVISRFVIKRGKLNAEIWNWTAEGKLKMSKTLRDEARKITDFNIIEGYALWMTSAWLESQMRSSEKARTVFKKLDELGRAHEISTYQAVNESGASNGKFDSNGSEGPLILGMLSELGLKVMNSLGVVPAGSKKDVFDWSEPQELSEEDGLTVVAAIFGIAGTLAMELSAKPDVAIAISHEFLTGYGFNDQLVRNGLVNALHQYKPNPTEHYGIAAWRGAEVTRRYRQGIDEEFNSMYPVSWVYDHEWTFKL